jgi:isopentenyl-diphosphate delta-isomerase
MTSHDVDGVMSGLDSTQVQLMAEQCILVNEDDQKIGTASKKVCHLVENINKGMLHRAFSVFLFNTQGQLLLQQRSLAKITFPDHWTNTCCSHPLNFEAELVEADSLGVRRAAQRKLKHELGIEPADVPLDSFEFLTRIHYRADNIPHDGIWAEHEIDHILIIRRDVTVHPNMNEVRNYRFVTRDELRHLVAESETNGTLLTPWFKLIVNSFLWKWWDHLESLESCKDHNTIHRMC